MDAIEKLQASLADRYAVIREIGAGGMATVYLARDIKHDRHVALKVLRPELGAVLGVERFLSEIKVTAHLQHPHLLPLFDSGEAEGLLFYVMPYVEGESLRVRLDRENQLPMDDALRFVLAVASALEYAHKQGVVHRDLKPENILLLHGEPVVSDFGIALAVSKAGGARVTQTGLSLGTPQYMSPEQATGDREIDARSDQYSLAAVLYEMLTGEPPHSGKTAQAIIARVLTERPSSARLQRDTVAPHVDAALMRALAKLPADRFPSVGAFAEALKNPNFTTAQGTAATLAGMPAAGAAVTTAGVRRSRVREVAFGVVALAAVAWGAFATWHRQSAPEPYPVRFTLSADTGIVPIFVGTWSVVPSPDGRTVVYTAMVHGHIQLVARSIDAVQARPIAGTEGATQPIFSPDGKWIAFVASNKLRKVLVGGGSPITLADAGANNGIDWSVHDELIFGDEGGKSGLSRMAAAGGVLQEFTKVDTTKGENSHLWPVVLPDGNTIVFTIWDGKTKAGSRLAITSLKDGKVTNLGVAGIRPLGVFDGELAYVQADGSVMAVPIDVSRRRLTGSPVPVLDSVPVCPGCNGDAGVFASRNGTLAYYRGSTLNRMVWVSKTGAVQRVRENIAAHSGLRLSPDGTRIAVAIEKGVPDIWVLTLASGTLSRLTSGGANTSPEWSADGKYIVFSSDRGGKAALWRQAADGSGEPQIVASGGAYSGSVSPDGKTVLFTVFAASFDIMVKTVGDTSPARKFLAAPYVGENYPQFSPDGHWVAYASDETGANEVYVRAFADGGGRVQISAGGGTEPTWSSDGRKLFYRFGRRMMAANVTTTPSLVVTSRDSLFEGLFDAGDGAARGYDVSRDGSRFLMLRGNDENMQVVVVTNWLAEIKARMGRK